MYVIIITLNHTTYSPNLGKLKKRQKRTVNSSLLSWTIGTSVLAFAEPSSKILDRDKVASGQQALSPTHVSSTRAQVDRPPFSIPTKMNMIDIDLISNTMSFDREVGDSNLE